MYVLIYITLDYSQLLWMYLPSIPMRTLFVWIEGSNSSTPSHLVEATPGNSGWSNRCNSMSMVGKKNSLLAVQNPFFTLTFWRKFSPKKTKAGWNL
jgi:hypothetical protein